MVPEGERSLPHVVAAFLLTRLGRIVPVGTWMANVFIAIRQVPFSSSFLLLLCSGAQCCLHSFPPAAEGVWIDHHPPAKTFSIAEGVKM
jgi:hypothetical protein